MIFLDVVSPLLKSFWSVITPFGSDLFPALGQGGGCKERHQIYISRQIPPDSTMFILKGARLLDLGRGGGLEKAFLWTLLCRWQPPLSMLHLPCQRQTTREDKKNLSQKELPTSPPPKSYPQGAIKCAPTPSAGPLKRAKGTLKMLDNAAGL